MGFFDNVELVQPTKYADLPPQPPWVGPGDNVLGGLTSIDGVIAQNEEVLIAARHFIAYPEGVAFTLEILSREARNITMRPIRIDPFEPQGNETGDSVLRLGVEYADGRRATSLDPFPKWKVGGKRKPPPDAVELREGGARGNGRSWSFDWWLWPLPPAGPLALVVQWPARGVPESRLEIDASPLISASKSALVLWPDSRRGTGSWAQG